MAKTGPASGLEDATATALRSEPGRTPIGVVLRAMGADAKPVVFHLKKGTCIVGSGADADISIADRTVSRRHVELGLVPEGVRVTDLGSRNGTFYLGQRVGEIVASVGTRLVIGGSVTLAIEPDPSLLDELPPSARTEYRGVVGVSLAMRKLYGLLERLEGSLVPVLIEGESGVGKELIAKALHAGSRLSTGPFVALNCGAVARELVASELFGHKRGAFTGALETRRGAFEAAHGGTLFLDEIGELPLEVQPVLLRALETGEVRAVGDDQVKTPRVRVVAATNRDLEQRVREGAFRDDLYYRIAVVKVRVPPLSERPDDIEPLAREFAREEEIPPLSAEILSSLRVRSYPGNARELRNVVRAYAALGVLPGAGKDGAPLRARALRDAVDLSRPYAAQRDELVEEFTRYYLEALLAQTGGQKTQAAEIAGLDRTYLGRLLQKLGMSGR